MNKQNLNILVLLTMLASLAVPSVSADEVSHIVPVQRTQYAKIQYTAKEFKSALDSLDKKFMNLNIQTVYEDMSGMILDNEGHDYYLVLLADEAVNFGFFDLAKLAFSKVSDYDIAHIDSENSQRLFFPKYNMKTDDIIVLAEALSNIEYNDRSSEAIKEILEKVNNIDKNDYANYMLALGYMKTGDLENAKKYIDNALAINSNNLNYKILKSQVVASGKKPKKANKLAKDAKNKASISYYPIKQKIESNEEFIKYKTEKQPWLKDYHLGYYYYLNNDNSKALRILQSAISKNNSRNALLYSLMSRIYIKNGDYEKASIVASKAYDYNVSNVNTLLSLGDIAYENNKYKQALKYYKKAASTHSNATEAKLKLADTYAKLNNSKSNSIYEQLIKSDNTAYEAFYQLALNNPENELSYLKKSVAINPNFKDGWIDLSRVMIENGNLAQAKKYLENAYYLDGNDFRYYYYQSLLIKKTEELNKLDK